MSSRIGIRSRRRYRQAILLEAFGREVGAWSGRFEVAEGFRRRLHYGFCDAADDPLHDLGVAYCERRQ